MSDVMLFEVLNMPYEMAMGNEYSRYQFWQRARDAVGHIASQEARIAELESQFAAASAQGEPVSGQKDARICYSCGHPAHAHPMVQDRRGGTRRGNCPAKSAVHPSPSVTPDTNQVREVAIAKAALEAAKTAIDLCYADVPLSSDKRYWDGAVTTCFRSVREIDPQAILAALKSAPAVEPVGMRTLFDDAMNRMDRARKILTDGNPTPHCNWGILDTTDLRKALAASQQGAK